MAMFKAFGDNDARYSGLNAALVAAGGDISKLLEDDPYYWSSTPYPYAEANAYRVDLYEGEAFWGGYNVGNDYRVRACLAF